ncbi:MAG: glycoside hydrolase [Nitrospirales bacterium]|nr:exo-alpha-sialidase [Nitrospira sp.]MDR4501815.1 glycoside hydrolase [Nitrospirales bacterium]
MMLFPLHRKPCLLLFLMPVWLTLIFCLQAAAESPQTPTLGTQLSINHGAKKVSGAAIQIDEQGNRHLAWYEAGKERHELFYVAVTAGATTVPSAVHVNQHGPPVAAIHQSPSLAVGPTGDVYLSWTSPQSPPSNNPFASTLRLSTSKDRGQTFSMPIIVNDDTTPSSHTFDNMCVDRKGVVHLAWIDERTGKRQPKTYITRSLDRGGSVAKNLQLEGNTCVCCRTALASAPDGTVYVAWRQILDDTFRETVVARSTDGGKTYSSPVIVGNDRWNFPGCPHRPASLAVDGKGRVYVTWYTEGPDDVPGIYLAMSDDQGRTFSPRKKLNVSTSTFPDTPQMAVDRSGRVLVAWEELSPVRHEIYFSSSLDRGQTFSPPQRLNNAKAQHPAVAVNQQGQGIISWVEHAFPNNVTIVQNVTLP